MNLNFRLCATILVSIVSSSASTVVTLSMWKVNYTSSSMTTLGNSFVLDSAFVCALQCLKHKNVCHAFTYNNRISNCTLGSWIVIPSGPRVDPATDVYTSGAFCNKVENFELVTNETASACLWMSQIQLDYLSARASCQERGAHLYTMKSIDKLYLLVGYLKPKRIDVWIGLDDLWQENSFRWSDDGSELIEPLRGQLFAPGQPNDLNQQQDCVLLSTSKYPLNDCLCNLTYYFICEMNDFF